MKVIYLVPGSGNRFYCQNCLRDEALVKEMRLAGLDVVVVPLYLPMADGALAPSPKSPVFYGAINVYLAQKLPGFGRLPRWCRKAFDGKRLLAWPPRRQNPLALSDWRK